MNNNSESTSTGNTWGPHLAAAAFVICTGGGTASATNLSSPFSASTSNVASLKQLQSDRGPRLQRKRLDSSSGTILNSSAEASAVTYVGQWVKSVVSHLHEVGKLGKNWNGEGALPVAREVVDRLELFCWTLPSHIPAPNVKVGAEGNAGLYWDTNEGYLELDAMPAGEFVIYHADSDHEPIAYHEVRTIDDALANVLQEWGRHIEMEPMAVAG